MTRAQPPKAETNDPLVRTMRETCAHFTDAADEANFLARPFLVLLAELLCRIFGKIEDIVLLWRAGLIPPPAPKPEQAPRVRTRKIRNRTRRRRTNRRTPVLRPLGFGGPKSRTPAFAIEYTPPHARKPAPTRRIDRPPKAANPPQISAIPRPIRTPSSLRYQNNLMPSTSHAPAPARTAPTPPPDC